MRCRHVHTGIRRAPLDLARIQRRRQVLRQVAEDRAVLAALDRIPIAHDALGAVDLDVAEDVRVAADQLVDHPIRDRGQAARAALLEQQRQEVDLKENVAELVDQLVVVALDGGVGQLVRLLNRVRHDRALVLLAVPWAFHPQPAGYLIQTGETGSRAVVHRLAAGGAGAGGLRRRRLRLRRAAGGRRRVRLLLRRVRAVRDQVVLGALRLVAVVLAELRDEGVERLLLVLRLEQVPDRLLGLRERLLRGWSLLRDLEDVVAELRLDGTGRDLLLCREDRVVEGLLLLPLGDARKLAALSLGGLVDRVLLRDRSPALAACERLLGGRGLGLGLRQHDEQVTALGLREALLVLVVVGRDLSVADLVLALDHLGPDVVGDDVQLHPEEQVSFRHAGLLKELLVVRLLLEGLLL